MNINTTAQHISIHDPAIIEDQGMYYIFGTHRRFARSTDLIHWEPLENNLSRDPYAVLGDIWDAWPKQPENNDLLDNMWAPDVIWNPTLHQWCMYMSINGANYRSVIVLLTAPTLDADWTYQGPVIYSGFDEENIYATDVPRVLGYTDTQDCDITRYRNLKDTQINAIDAAPVYCEHGELWMSVGSWFGGIWMIKLDQHTGLRDYSTTYPLIKDASDPYYGIKIAGGYWNSGEGSYFVRHNGWWYLFISYGWLGQTGGYQIRLFRSRHLLGPYYDQFGNPAICNGEIPDNHERNTGIRILSSALWDGGPSALHNVEVSQGHNSVLQRQSDGRLFLVYHTRFAQNPNALLHSPASHSPQSDEEGTTQHNSEDYDYYETHVRELLPTIDGWLVTAPYEYQGEVARVPDMPRMSSQCPSELCGEYELIRHNPHTYFNGQLTSDGTYYGINTPERITLHPDGRVTRGGVIEFFDTPDANLPRSTDGPATCGSWKLIRSSTHEPDIAAAGNCTVNTSPTPYYSDPCCADQCPPILCSSSTCCPSDIIIRIDGIAYTGVVCMIPRNTDGQHTITFSAIGANQAIWGSRIEHVQ